MLTLSLLGIFGANSSKATKFGTDIEQIILFRFAMDVKTGIAQGRCISKIKDGRHSDSRYTLPRIPKGLWPRDISLCVIFMANLATSDVILFK